MQIVVGRSDYLTGFRLFEISRSPTISDEGINDRTRRGFGFSRIDFSSGEEFEEGIVYDQCHDGFSDWQG
jgi:hypothetical protein